LGVRCGKRRKGGHLLRRGFSPTSAKDGEPGPVRCRRKGEEVLGEGEQRARNGQKKPAKKRGRERKKKKFPDRPVADVGPKRVYRQKKMIGDDETGSSSRPKRMLLRSAQRGPRHHCRGGGKSHSLAMGKRRRTGGSLKRTASRNSKGHWRTSQNEGKKTACD